MTRYPDPVTLDQLFSRFRKRRLRDCSPKTIENYRNELRRLQGFLDREPLLTDLQNSSLADLLQHLTDSGASPNTVNKCRACLTAMARYANRKGYIKGRARVPKANDKPRNNVADSIEAMPEGPTMNVDPKLSAYIGPYSRERDLSKKYVRVLTDTIERFERWHKDTHNRPCTIGTITDDVLNQWIIHLRDAENLKTATLRGYRNCVLCVWRGAFQARIVDHEPRRIIKVRVDRGDPVAFTRDELEAMIIEAGKLEGWFKQTGIAKSDFFVAFINVAYDTGLRLGDVLELKRSDFDTSLEASLIQGKTGRRHRVKLRPSTMEHVDKIFPPERELIFPLWARKDQFFVLFRNLAKQAGCYKPNDLTRGIRRASASYLERDHPGAASAHLGHRTADLARRHYIDPRIARQDIVLPASLGTR